jgi:hypothetical protein
MAFPAACYPRGCQQSAAFVGPLDALVAQGATFLYAASTYRLVTSYTGPLARLQGNGTGSPEADIGYLTNGQIDLAAAAAIAAQDGGTAAFGVTWYGQLGGRDAAQANAANRMPFSTALNAKGGWGDGTAVASDWFNINLDVLPTGAFISIVAKTVTETGGRVLLGTSASSTNRYVRTSNGAMQSNWGTLLSGSALEVPDGLHVLGFLVNGATSKHYIDGSLILTGNTNTTQLSLTNGRIGAGQSGTAAYLNTAGNAILEVVIFAADPTGLAGFPAFVTNQIARFA